jgi:superfamily II DNA or RNA helicase
MNDELNLSDFLPSYGDINEGINEGVNENLNPYNENFYVTLNNKKEFSELKLGEREKRPEFKGDLYKHQKIISRFLSSYTMYNSLLLFHYMGTGKTCSAFGTTEKIRKEDELRVSNGENPIFKGVIILARGQGLINNLVNELIFKCSTGDKYVPENYETLTVLEKNIRKKKKIQDYYKFHTFYTFAKEIFSLSNEEIKRRYSNRIIIIDEVHNIRKAEDKEENVKVTYDEIHRFLHTITNSKILLLSGTPMRDEANEISMVMNLILPLEKQLPREEDFDKEFMKKQNSELNYLVVRKKKIDKLKEYFKGTVSYLSSLTSLSKEYIGNYTINNINTFTLDTDEMSKFQSKYYYRAFKKDKSEAGIYTNSKQASLFVFPSGKYGKEGFITLKKHKTRYLLSNEIINYLNEGVDGNIQKKLENLKRLSSKYHKTINQLLFSENRSAFVYCNLVEGSGAIIFSLLLQEFGFSQANGNEKNHGLRYAILTHTTTTIPQMSNIINRFNHPDNCKGNFIKIIIGSRVAGEGLTLLNIQDIHILTPFWNYAEISQAISRGIREGSHDILIQNGIQPQIKIYQHTSIPQIRKGNEYIRSDKLSIDLEMYKTSASKDISIKSVERIMKESAMDCGLTYKVNFKPENKDYSRECDYQICDYICDGLENYNYSEDLSTYNLYYSDKVILELQHSFEKLFRNNFSISIDEFKNISDNSYYEIITALRNLINYNLTLKNKYGFSCYLKENNNNYFLVNSISSLPEKFSEYYVKNPYIKDPIKFSTLLNEIQVKYIPIIIETLPMHIKDESYFLKLINRVPTEIKESLIESSILAREKGIKKNIKFRDKIISFFEHYIEKIEECYISSFLYEEYNTLRCLSGNIWKNCSRDIEEKWTNRKEELQIDLENNKYGYYGIYDPEKEKFWIRDVTEENKIESEDRRSKTTGSECNSTGWSRQKLLKLIYDIKLEYPEDYCEKISKKDVYDKAMKNTWLKTIINKSMSKEDLCRLLYYSSFNKGKLCPVLREWFRKNNLLVIGKKDEKK